MNVANMFTRRDTQQADMRGYINTHGIDQAIIDVAAASVSAVDAGNPLDGQRLEGILRAVYEAGRLRGQMETNDQSVERAASKGVAGLLEWAMTGRVR